MVPMAFTISALIFFASRLSPIDPINAMVPPDMAADSANLNQLREELGLNDHIILQYFHWLKNIASGEFGYILQRIRRVDSTVAMPFYMVITDSTMINQTWYRYPCDGAIVADEPTAEVLRGDGVAEGKIHVLGFPVGLQFDEFMPSPPPHDGNWRLLFFPGGPLQRAFETLNHLSTIENVSVTVITGRRQDAHAALLRAGLPKRGHLIGWTDKMPDLMGSHHIFIGKAGGATVQEAIAAQIPFVVNHIVPGQEEGNIALIQQTAIGALASNSPADVLHIVKGAMANEAALWRTWRKNLVQIQKPSASRAIASFLLERAISHKS